MISAAGDWAKLDGIGLRRCRMNFQGSFSGKLDQAALGNKCCSGTLGLVRSSSEDCQAMANLGRDNHKRDGLRCYIAKPCYNYPKMQIPVDTEYFTLFPKHTAHFSVSS